MNPGHQLFLTVLIMQSLVKDITLEVFNCRRNETLRRSMSVIVDIKFCLETITRGSAQLRNGQLLGLFKPAEPKLSQFVWGHMAACYPQLSVLAEM